MIETPDNYEEDMEDNLPGPAPPAGLPFDLEKLQLPDKYPKNYILQNAIYSTIMEGIGLEKWKRIVEPFIAELRGGDLSILKTISISYYRKIHSYLSTFLDKAVQSCDQCLSLSDIDKVVSFDGLPVIIQIRNITCS